MQLSKFLAFSLLAGFTSALPQPELSKRLINPDRPHLSKRQQCTWREEYSSIYKYNVVVNNAKVFTHGVCGKGFLDNMHGEGCTVTNWGCNYDGKSMNANFNTDLGCNPEKIEWAIWKAFGGRNVECHQYFHF